MMNTTTNATVNATTIKEETTMKKRAIAIVDTETKECVETTLDALSLEELINMKELTKDIIRAYLEEEQVIISNNEFKKTKRAALIESLYAIMHPITETTESDSDTVTETSNECKCTRCGGSGIFYTRVENNIPIKAIPDDGMCYRCNGTGIEPHKETVPVGDFSNDTAPVSERELLRQYLDENAKENQKHKLGYTVSAFMLCALILKAYCGIEKLRGNEKNITSEQQELVKKIRSELQANGYVTPVLYTVTQDVNVRVYVAGYPGRTENTDNNKIKIYPYTQYYAKMYTPDKPTSYVLNLDNWK